MKCPKCFREIDELDAFCGFCGAKIGQAITPVSKKKKTKSGMKIFMLFSMIAMMSGVILGFCMARGIVDWEHILKQNQFQWTDFSEAVIEKTQNEETPQEESKSNSQKLIIDSGKPEE